jgi:hypothetical protein
VAKGVGPEFKPQYHKKKKREKKRMWKKKKKKKKKFQPELGTGERKVRRGDIGHVCKVRIRQKEYFVVFHSTVQYSNHKQQ